MPVFSRAGMILVYYNIAMYNWSTDTTELKKYPEKYAIWKLEQLINYGLDGEKLDKKLLIKYLDKIRIDPDKRAYLEFLLYEKKPTD